MMQIDDDLEAILRTISGHHIKRSWSIETIVRLVMETQRMRQTVKVAQILDPNQFNTVAAQQAKQDMINQAAVAPQEYYKNNFNQRKTQGD